MLDTEKKVMSFAKYKDQQDVFHFVSEHCSDVYAKKR